MNAPGPVLRDARHADVGALLAIAAAGGSPDADERYLDFVASEGRLVVVEVDGRVAGFAGAVLVGDVAMVTDLFVQEEHRGLRLGNHLGEAVVAGHPRRMTFSSQHPAAQAVYRALGMTERWDLLTWRGMAIGGGAPLVPSPWRHDRRELIEHFRSNGAVVSGDVVVQPARDDRPAVVLRLVADEPESAIAAVLAAIPLRTAVELSVPEPNRLSRWLAEHGFDVVDRDICFASDGVHLLPQVAPLHRGLL